MSRDMRVTANDEREAVQCGDDESWRRRASLELGNRIFVGGGPHQYRSAITCPQLKVSHDLFINTPPCKDLRVYRGPAFSQACPSKSSAAGQAHSQPSILALFVSMEIVIVTLKVKANVCAHSGEILYSLWMSSRSSKATLIPKFCLFERIWYNIALSYPNFRLLFAHDMLDENLARILRFELPNEAWVPELTGDPEVFAASHHRVGFTAFRSRRNSVWREVVLLAASDRYQPGQNESVVSVMALDQNEHTVRGQAARTP